MGKHRQERVSREILRVLSTALLEDAKDPNLLEVTITDISISADLSSASVRYLCPPAADRHEVQASLQKATPYLRSVIADEMDLRRVPSLKFFYDDAYEKGQQISELLAKLRANGEMGTDAPLPEVQDPMLDE